MTARDLGPCPWLEVDADSVRVVIDGELIWSARVVAHQRYEAGGEAIATCWPPMRQTDVARRVAESWRRHTPRGIATPAEIRRAWITHWRAWRMVHN